MSYKLKVINYKIKKGLYVLLTVLLVQGCAKIVTPVGGPKDTTPPKITHEQPINKCTHFKAKQIKITFDEFVTLGNPNENVLISPPPASAPVFTLNGKSLIIKFKDTLQPNTTYNIVCSNFIRDYHEGNILNYYHYCFSTGPTLDSFMVKGSLLDAQTLKPQADFFVMLYKHLDDSLPLTTKPDYLTKSLTDGSFSFENIAPGTYKIFALKDINADLIYDLPNEEIAFQNLPVHAFDKQRQRIDSLAKDSAVTQHDSIPSILLFSFTEIDTAQKLLRYENPQEGLYLFPYKVPFNTFTATPLHEAGDYFQITSPTFDTITWYMKKPLKDSLVYIFKADNQVDTVTIIPYKAKPNAGRGRGNALPKLGVSFENSGQLYKPLTLKFNFPIQPVSKFDIMVCTQQKSGNDTTLYTASVPNSFTTSLQLPITFESKKTYSVMIADSVFQGYNAHSHDTLRTQFTTKTDRDYGNLTMHYTISGHIPYIIQLWRGTTMVQENTITLSQAITYEHLEPGSYQIKVIYDSNENQRWDTGNYRTHQQPESVLFFQKPISIRAFWDIEEDIVIPDQESQP